MTGALLRGLVETLIKDSTPLDGDDAGCSSVSTDHLHRLRPAVAAIDDAMDAQQAEVLGILRDLVVAGKQEDGRLTDAVAQRLMAVWAQAVAYLKKLETPAVEAPPVLVALALDQGLPGVPQREGGALVAAPVLSILCITKAEPHAEMFLKDMAHLVNTVIYGAELVVVVDGVSADADRVQQWLAGWAAQLRVILPPADLQRGFLESLLHEAVQQCRGDYVLRLDDDERINTPMYLWLLQRGFRVADHWKFDRAHLWGDEKHYIPRGPLWPDHQTRLSIRSKAGGRHTIHSGSPHGGGELAPRCVIEHHCFLVRTREERLAKMARYNQIYPGAGWPIFNVPEDVYVADGTDINDHIADYSPLRHPSDPL